MLTKSNTKNIPRAKPYIANKIQNNLCTFGNWHELPS